MTKEQAIKGLKDILSEATMSENSVCYVTGEDKETLETAINALEQQPSEDCVSRAEMLKYQQYLRGKMSNEENHKLWEFIKDLPPVTPTQNNCKDYESDLLDFIGAMNLCDEISNEAYAKISNHCADYEKRGNENEIN